MRQLLSLLLFLVLLLPRLLSAQINFNPRGELTPPPSNTPPEQKCLVQGHVTDAQSGEPLKKAVLRLTRTGTTAAAAIGTFQAISSQGYATSSEPDGGFRFEGVEPGDYTLSAQRTGYLDLNYGARGRLAPGAILTLRPAQQLTKLNVALTRQAVISGKVLDEDGDPAPNMTVQVLSAHWMHGKLHYVPTGGASTNDLGEFRIADLGPGRYYLYTEQPPYMSHNVEAPAVPGKPDVRPIRTFYPSAVTRASATPIEIAAGQDAPGMDIRLHTAATYHVRGKIAGAAEGELDHLSISLLPKDDDSMVFFFGPNSGIQKDLTFDIPGVAPGAYTLNVYKMGGMVRSLARQPVEVGSTDLNGVVVNIIPPISLHGQIRVEGTPQANNSQVNISSVHVSLSPTDRGAIFGGTTNASVKPEGSFTLENVSPGKYYVHARAGNGTYLKAVRFGQEEVLGKELDLSQSSGGQLEVIFRYGCAEVDGTVLASSVNPTDSQNTAQARSGTPSVLLIPEPLGSDDSGMRQAGTDSTGAFSIKQISPGHYRAYAFEQVESDQLYNPDLLSQLESKGVELELKENDKKQVQLPLISADELQQLLVRFGIEAQ